MATGDFPAGTWFRPDGNVFEVHAVMVLAQRGAMPVSRS